MTETSSELYHGSKRKFKIFQSVSRNTHTPYKHMFQKSE